MKNGKIKIYISALLVACGITVSANAFLLPPGPGTPTADPVADVLFFLNTASTAVQNATAQASAFIQNINQQAKAALSKYVGKFTGFMGGIFKKKEKQPLPGSKEIQESKLVDIYDPAAVQAIMYQLFFQYPVDCDDHSDPDNIKICEAYKKMALEFYQDTIIEIYTSSRELEKQFDVIETSIEEIETSLQEGNSGAESPDDENGVWKNAYNTYETMNTILKIIEEIQAMRAQYIAAQTIGSFSVYPAKPQKADDGKSAMNEDNSLFISQSVKMADGSFSQKQTLGFADEADDGKTLTYKSSVDFATVPSSGLASPYAANSENMAQLDNVYKAYDYLKEALEVHNQAKGLETVKQAYDTYDKARRLHEKALESLKKSEQCAINYYSYMYTNPQQFWNGGLSESRITDYDARKGISGWAVKAYNLAKAEDSETVVEADDLAEVNVDTTDVDSSDLSQTSKLASKFSKDSGGFTNSAKQQEINENLKESGRLAWNIGSEAARMLAEDQAANGQNGKWGQARVLYPVWHDTEAYYNQYIEGKYNNIATQLETVNTNNLALQIAEKLNNLVDLEEERSHNRSGLSKLKTALANEKSSAISNYETIVAEKKSRLDALYEEKEAKLAELNRQKTEAEKRIDAIQARLDSLNIELQDAGDEKKTAEATVSAMEDLVNSLYKRELDLPEIEFIETTTEEYKKDLNASILGKQSSNLLKGFYREKEQIANAQLAAVSFRNNADDELETLNTDQSNIRTYTRTVETVKTIDYDESESLLLAQHTLSENREKVLQLNAKITSLTSEIDKLTAEQKALKSRISNEIEPAKEAVNNQYVLDTNETTVSYDAKLAAAEKDYLSALRKINNMDLGSYYRSHFNIPTHNSDGTVYLFSLPSILSRASGIVSETRDAAQEMVRNTVKQMYNMGSKLYNPDNHAQVVGIHKDLMNKLKKLPVSELRNFGANISYYGSYSGIEDLLSTIYQSYMVSDACTHDYCMQSDVEFYVSNNGKRRDFQAPKAVPQIPLPSVRETVYFDYSDYDAVPKSTNGGVAAKDLLQNLTYVPEIWKLILTTPSYVEKDIDLNAVIQPSTAMFNNGGIYPCIYGSYLVVSDGSRYRVHYHKKYTDEDDQKAEDAAYSRARSVGYMQCEGIEITGSGKYLSVKNTFDDVSGSATTEPYLLFSAPVKNSELGYLLQYSGGLRYNSAASTAFSRLSSVNKNGSSDTSQADILYDYASLNRNQIGEFLKAMDFEQETSQNMAEAAVEMEKVKQSLYETFAKIGFTPSSGFDLSKNSDYELAKNTLLRYRNKLLSSAVSYASPLQGNSNEIIQERMVKINNLIKAMQKDADANVSLGEMSADNAELDESLKSAKTNSSVSDKYKEQADADFEKQLQQIGNVYCAELVGNM